jgi:hypothetical protein
MTWRRDALAFASALIFYTLFYSLVFLQSLRASNYIAPSDTLDFGVATYLSEPALWTGGMYSGYPVAADPQTLTWYPLLQLFRVLEVPWNVFMISAYVLASACCFLLVRRLTGSTLAAVLGGFTYGFSGVMLVHMSHFNQIHAAAWLPLVVYGLHLIRSDRVRAGSAITATAYALMWLAGHPQVAVYTFYLCAALVCGWLLIDRPGRKVLMRRGVWSAAGLASGITIAAVLVLPMLELGDLSRRATSRWDLYIQDALPPRQLLGLVFPLGFGGFFTPDEMRVPYIGDHSPVQTTSYMGLLPLGLAVVSVIRASSARKDARLWLSLAAIALLLSLGPATPIGSLFFYVPGYASFQLPARHLFLATFCVAVASGLGLAHVMRTADGRRAVAAGVAMVAAAGLLCAVVVVWRTPAVQDLVTGNPYYLRWAVAWPLGTAGVLIVWGLVGGVIRARGAVATTVLVVVLLAIHVGDLAVVHYMLPGYHFRYAEIPPERVAPHPRIAALGEELRERGQRVLAMDGSRNRFLLPNLPRAWNLPAASGTGSLGIERYVDLLGMGGSGDVAAETLSPQHRGLDLLGIRYVMVPQRSPVTGELRAQPDRWTAVEELQYSKSDPDTWYTLFVNSRARPRAWCVSEAVTATARQVLGAVRAGALPEGRGFDPAEMALVDDSTPSEWRITAGGGGTHSEVVTTVPSSGERRYLVSAELPCLLVVSEVYYPWWRASVDDSRVEIARVNHTLMAVLVPAGSHVVRLWLQPVSLWIGAAISGLTVLVWIGLLANLDSRWPERGRRGS